MNAFENYIGELRKGSTDLLLAVHNVSPAQSAFHPAGKWSITEIIGHLLLVEQAVLRILSKPTPPDKVKDSSEKIGREKISAAMQKNEAFPAPDSVVPSDKKANLTQLQKQFLDTRNQIIEGLGHYRFHFDNQIIKHPIMGDMTKKDWLHFLIHHAERHLRQVDELKKDPAYPKS